MSGRIIFLIGGELIAIDGSKFCSVNHNSKVLTSKEFTYLLKQVDENIEEYFRNLDNEDLTEQLLKQTGKEELIAAIS